MDVAVHGTKDGSAHLTLIECKDWQVPVGIAVIDALDSKRRDLRASAAVVFSNSGFTEDARRKAARMGISLAAALKAGDPQIRVQLWKELVSEARSIDKWSLTVFPRHGGQDAPEHFSPYELTYLDKPVVNWLRRESWTLLSAATSEAGNFEIVADYEFADGAEFAITAQPIVVLGIRVTLQCSTRCVRQAVREDVSLGLYDFVSRRVAVPDGQAYLLGPIDRDGWTPCETQTDPSELQPGTFRVDVTPLSLIRSAADPSVPELSPVVTARSVRHRDLA